MIFPMIPPIMTPPEPPTTNDYRVFDILQESGIADTDNILQITVDGDEIVDFDTVYNLWTKRQDYVYSQSKLNHFYLHGVEIDGGYIFAEWSYFISRNGENLVRMIAALYSDYNPINNYDMIEKSVDGETLDEIETTPSGKTITKSYAAGLNSSGDGALTGKNETSFENAKSTTSPKNTKSVTLDSETLANVHKATQHILTRSGNIGVTTSAQMITQEIELRVIDLIDDFVKRFFDMYTRYVG